MKVAIISTQRTWNTQCEPWVQYHLSRGFNKIYIYVDDGRTDHIPPTSGVEFIACTKAYWDSFTPGNFRGRWSYMETIQRGFGTALHSTPENVMLRQIFNTYTALNRAAEDGIDWLLHIDDDEYFWCPYTSVNEHFHEIHPGVGAMEYLSHEAILLCEEDLSKGQRTFFRRNWDSLTQEQRTSWEEIVPGKPHFTSYSGVKSAARVRLNTIPNGCHYFHIDPALKGARSAMPCILHRPYQGINHFCDKHMSNGIFSDLCFGAPWAPPPIYTLARQLIADKDVEGLRSLFSQAVTLTNAELDKLEAAGYLLSIETPLPFRYD